VRLYIFVVNYVDRLRNRVKQRPPTPSFLYSGVNLTPSKHCNITTIEILNAGKEHRIRN
jgi:hypothetical protein